MTVKEEETMVSYDPQHTKSRGAAFILSLIPGGGYMYLGLMNRGLQAMLIFFGTIFLSNLLNMGILAGMIIPILMLYTIFDTQQLWTELTQKGSVTDRGFWAWSSIGLKNPVNNNGSSGKHQPVQYPGTGQDSGRVNAAAGYTPEQESTNNESESGPGLSESPTVISSIGTPEPFGMDPVPEAAPPKRQRRFVLAYILIGLGVLALINNLFPSLMLERFWDVGGVPALMIVLGLVILFRNLDGRRGGERSE